MEMDWSRDRDRFSDDIPVWHQAGSNLLLDFHGDPASAGLVVFSDGNHHMALADALRCFQEQRPELADLFYATTPPHPILNLLRAGRLQLGNFVLSVSPDLFIGPPHILEDLVAEGHLTRHLPFVRNQGNVLLVKKGNPKKILAGEDLRREEVTLFLSNPEREAASHQAYADTLANLLGTADITAAVRILYGEHIHHREAPEAVARGRADAAVLFYHLALHCARRFPELFEMVPLGGSVAQPAPLDGNPIGYTHVGLVGDGGAWGQRFIDFLFTKTVRDIYRHHGLVPLQ
ncbi:MAG: substrate-binding domain-containing protein [Desulfosarcinaceae bacterium]|nr:substrate-binding domain-containing protein [Desulfosarcinaceae bacterium]